MNCRYCYFVIASLIYLFGCQGQDSSRAKKLQRPVVVTPSELILFNQEKLRVEQELIDSISASWGWTNHENFIRSQSGMVAQLNMNRLSGPPISGDTIEWTGVLMLLDSTVIFEWDATAPFRFLLDQSAWPTGFNELAHVMGRGDRARCLLPSHLGWGLTGWPPLIPQDAVLLLDVEMDFMPRSSLLEEPEAANRIWDQILNQLEAGEFAPNEEWIAHPRMAGSPCIAWYDASRELTESGFLNGNEVEVTMVTLKAVSVDSSVVLGNQKWSFTVGDEWQLISVLEQLALQNPKHARWECWCPVSLAFGPVGLPAMELQATDVVGFQWEWSNVVSPALP